MKKLIFFAVFLFITNYTLAVTINELPAEAKQKILSLIPDVGYQDIARFLFVNRNFEIPVKSAIKSYFDNNRLEINLAKFDLNKAQKLFKFLDEINLTPEKNPYIDVYVKYDGKSEQEQDGLDNFSELIKSEYFRNVKGLNIFIPEKPNLNFSKLMKAIANSEHLADSLISFELFANIDDTAADIIAEKEWKKLERLSLVFNKITNDGVEKVINSEHMKNLKFLKLGHGKFTDAIIDKIIKSNSLDDIIDLSLQNIRIRDTKLKELLKWDNAKNLQVLQLYQAKLTKESAIAIAESDLPNLKELNISANVIGDEGVMALINKFDKNVRIKISSDNVSEDVINKFKKHFHY